jgi:hypothetical protein
VVSTALAIGYFVVTLIFLQKNIYRHGVWFAGYRHSISHSGSKKHSKPEKPSIKEIKSEHKENKPQGVPTDVTAATANFQTCTTHKTMEVEEKPETVFPPLQVHVSTISTQAEEKFYSVPSGVHTIDGLKDSVRSVTVEERLRATIQSQQDSLKTC